MPCRSDDMAFRVATYNVHSFIGTDRRFDPERIAHVIALLDADILAVQELGWHHRGRRQFDQFAWLAETTGYHVIEAPTKFHAGAHYGNAILVREASIHHRALDLSAPFHIPRGCVIAHLAIGGRPLTAINVHLGLTPWDRSRQLRRIIAELDHIAGETVLMGDFNSWRPDGPMFRALRERLPHYTTVPSFHARAPHVPLDRIYVSPGLEIRRAEAPRDRVTARTSDHLPVYADIGFRR